MTLDIREIDPCESCMRNRHDFDATDTNAITAGAYLLISAIETADSEAEVSADDEQAMANFLHNQSGLPSGAGGAVGYCGRAIGRNACEKWQVDLTENIITPRS